MVLTYPVIPFTDTSLRSGAYKALLGKNPAKTIDRYFSHELHVNNNTPPTFFVHADNDKDTPVEHALLMYKALRAKKIPAELHILTEGEHGFGLGLKNEHVASWTYNLKLWLEWVNALNK